MALINCPECGQQISDKAAFCPHCGNPMASGSPGQLVIHHKQQSSFEKAFEEGCGNAAAGCVSTILTIVLLIVIIAALQKGCEGAPSANSGSSGRTTLIPTVGKIHRIPGLASLARLIISGLPHHEPQFGPRRQQRFFRDEDYSAYLELMAQLHMEHRVAIWDYCPMRVQSVARLPRAESPAWQIVRRPAVKHEKANKFL